MTILNKPLLIKGLAFHLGTSEEHIANIIRRIESDDQPTKAIERIEE